MRLAYAELKVLKIPKNSPLQLPQRGGDTIRIEKLTPMLMSLFHLCTFVPTGVKICILYSFFITLQKINKQINRNLAEYIMKHFVIKYWWVFLCLVAVSLYSCDNNNLTGKSYQGYYNACERIYIEFESNSQVEGEISSTDFVGRFTDYVCGHYEYKHPYIIITWTKADSDNEVYKNVISNPDSTIVNESLDTLRLYEGNEEYILPRYHLYQIDENASFMEKVGQYSYQTFLLIIIFIVRYFFYIIAAIVILRFAIRWRKKRKK